MSQTKKIVLIGHFGVGKTSLVRRYIDSAFSEDYLVTLGVQVKKKSLTIDHSELNLVIWDLEGNTRVANMRDSYMLGTDGFIYVFDLTRPETFQNLNENLAFIGEKFPNIPIEVVGNKSDLIDPNFIDEFLEKNKLSNIVVTSAKDGSNVENMFIELATKLM